MVSMLKSQTKMLEKNLYVVENLTMNRIAVIAAILTGAVILPVCRAGGDPFYHSTWYGQTSPQLAWSSQSVIFNHPNSMPYSTLSGTNLGSPRFFHPGYGYVAPSSGFRSGVSDYGVTYAFGMHQPSMSNIGTFGTDPSASVYSTSQLFPRNAAGSVIPGTLHQPWYLPGSPGNHRPFQPTW